MLQKHLNTNKLKSNAGMTLIELMVATGIMTIVIVGAMSFLATSVQAKRELEDRYAITSFHKQVVDSLRDPLACTWTMAKGSATSTTNLDAIYNAAGEPIYLTYDHRSMPGRTYENGKIRITQLRVWEIEVSETRMIEVTYERHNGTQGNKTFKRNIILQDYFDSTSFVKIDLWRMSNISLGEPEKCSLRSSRATPLDSSLVSCSDNTNGNCSSPCRNGYISFDAVSINQKDGKKTTVTLCGL